MIICIIITHIYSDTTYNFVNIIIYSELDSFGSSTVPGQL